MQTNPEPKTATSSAEQAKSLDSGNRFSVARLSAVFWTWKTLILLIAITSPGPGYDTSTTLLDFGIAENSIFTPLSKLIQSLVRWDAIYFTSMAQRGHLYEQEWAFGIGISSTLSWLARREYGDIALIGLTSCRCIPLLTSTLVANRTFGHCFVPHQSLPCRVVGLADIEDAGGYQHP